MSDNYDIYKDKAIEACKQVFFDEYNRSLGIPLPIIDFVIPDSANFKSGEYYISIGERKTNDENLRHLYYKTRNEEDKWQIHLNFGLLPKSYKDFQEEVRVLTRHEIEHYMCCPFDVLTHFRMLKAIIDTYDKDYSHLLIDIVSLSGSIANQAADIIIDTKNFYRHRAETLKSEIAWIKKGGIESFKDLPSCSKLMFLTKEAIWKESLELFEVDKDLISQVNSLAEKFKFESIDKKSLFLSKTIEYTNIYFKLFEQDIKEQQKDNCNNESNQSKNTHNSHPQLNHSKDSQENGSQFVFQSPDKIKEALIQFAQEATLEQFSQVLSAAGLSLSEDDKNKMWFDAQNQDIIPIIEDSPLGSNDNYSYPTSWKLGDPIEEMDIMLSFSTSPIIIPGLTTKKWVQNSVSSVGAEKKDSDLLLIIDTSGSMGSLIDYKTNLHQAVLAAYGIIKYFENKKNHIALIGFSDRVTANVDWTKDYDFVKKSLLLNGIGGTNFPIQIIKSIIDSSKNQLVTVIITDGEIQNTNQTIDYFKKYLSEGNKLFIFLQDRKSLILYYQTLIKYGAHIYKASNAKEMRDSVLKDINV
ncbi:MAG: VWA domain-containing protein [Chitinophagaceae bacterium]|nr:VWA domain-containing protein [Chitinophagaceae bacterium]